MTMTDIQRDLFAMQDEAYRDFHSKLVPTLDKQRIIGVGGAPGAARCPGPGAAGGSPG